MSRPRHRSRKTQRGAHAPARAREVERESSDSGIVSPEKNALMEQHFREHPEGDPAVRRKNPVRGRIVVEEDSGYAGIMKVSKPARRARKRRAA